ncbi:MAG TPA: kelch repeat-containing protein, partial [Labilithrix sp.]|nr:kelch repeat-containing protein [Labilithrix sp.]
HGALVADGKLWVVGGTTGDFGTPLLDDVWAFDRASSTWTKVATLPAPLSGVTLGLAASGELLVMGRVPDAANETKTSPVFAVDRTSHAVRTMDAVPAKVGLWSLTPYRGCFIGYESGDTVDSSLPNLWRCTIANGATTWSSMSLQEHDFALEGLRGTSAPDGLRAYFVGRHLWEAIGK